MAQFDYLGTWNDSWQILARILERGGTRLVPDLWYTSPEPLYIEAIDSTAKEVLTKRRRLCIWADDFSRFPPIIKPVDYSRPDTLYTLQPTRGGPSIDFTLPPCYEEEGFTNLANGMCVAHGHYWNPESEVWERASANLQAGRKDIVRRMKQYLVRYKFHKHIWIGPDGLRLLEEGKARITGYGLEAPTTYSELMGTNEGP
jgi:hypothetical protein